MAPLIVNLTGQNLVRLLSDQLRCVVSSIIYQGPAIPLFAYAAVYQGSDPAAHWEEFDPNTGLSLVRSFNAPNAPQPVTINNPVAPFTMNPRPAGDPHAPVISAGEAVLLISTSSDLSIDADMLAKVLAPNQYNIQAVAVQIVPPGGLISNPRLVGQTSVVDLSWNRISGNPAPPVNLEFIDIVIADTLSQAQAAFNGTPGVDFVSIDTGTLSLSTSQDAGGHTRYHADGIPVTPSAHHWWRVNNNSNGVWYPSAIADFMSVGAGGVQPTISNITVTFS